MKEPIISIIIPVFNRADLIKETINSVVNQSSDNWECIIVDDGSADNTRIVLEELCSENNKLNWYKRNKNEKGASVCRNQGAAVAKGDYLIFLDSDDLIGPDFIKKRLELILKHPKYDCIVFPSVFFLNSAGDQNRLWNLLNKDKKDIERFLDQDAPWHTTGGVWRKRFFHSIGGFLEQALSAQDFEFHVRAIINGLSYFKVKDDIKNLDHYIRVDSSEQISKAKIEEQRAINRLNTFRTVLQEINLKYKEKTTIKSNLIGHFYRSAIYVRRAGLDKYSIKYLKVLVEEKVISKCQYLLLKISLVIEDSNGISFLKRFSAFILFRFYGLSNLSNPVDRTKGSCYFENKLEQKDK